MRTLLSEMEVAAVTELLPGHDDTVRMPIGEAGPQGRGDHIDLPAFCLDPRRDPKLPSSLRRRIDRFSALAYLAVVGLLDELPAEQRPSRERIGTFFCNTRAGWAYGQPELGLLVERGPLAMHAYQATAWFPAAAQGEVTIALDLRGCAKTVAGRESGFAEALWLARDALECGAVDLALVGVAESLVSDFVLRDWPAAGPLPTAGPAEGAVVVALRRPGTAPSTRLSRLGPPEPGAGSAGEWVPTLAAASRLVRAVTAAASADHPVQVALGGGYRVEVAAASTTPTATGPITAPRAQGNDTSHQAHGRHGGRDKEIR